MIKNRPHIVMIVMDTARASNFSCYGYSRRTTPHIDEIAEKGTLFQNAISPSPWTLPSHVSMFTGLYPSEHELTEDKIQEGKNIHSLSKKHDFPFFLPQILKNQGYQTFGFSNNPWISRDFGFHRGFDSFFESWKLNKNHSPFIMFLRMCRKLTPQMFHPFLNNLKARMRWLYHHDSGAEGTVRVMKEFLGKHRAEERPFFLFLNFMEPHLPYLPPKPFHRMFVEKGWDKNAISRVNQDHLRYIAKKTRMDAEDFELLRSLYDGEIAYLDSKMKEIFDFMKDFGIMDRVFLIITSDHGENIGEHNLMGHQFCLYDTLLRVPLIIKLPGSMHKGKREGKYVQLSDIFHTILDVLDIQIEGRDIFRRSFLNQNYGETIISEHEVPKIALSSLEKRFPDFALQDFDQELRCLYFNDMKYIWNSKAEDELFDLADDPEEAINLIYDKKEEAERLSELLKERMESFKAYRQRKESAADFLKEDMSAEIKDRLRDLGYI